MRTIATSSFVAVAIAVAVAGFASTVQAQLDPSLVTGLSTGCATGLLQIVTSSDISSCLALPQAVAALTSSGNTSSLVPGLNQYLGGSICGLGKPACTQAQLSAANTTLQQACASDFETNNGGNIPALVYYFINSYDQLRTAGCLQDSQNQFCLVNDLYTLQNVTHMPLTLNSIQSIISNKTTQQQSLQALAANKSAFCTDCTHGLYTVLNPNNTNLQLAGAINQTCNSTYLDGKVPSTIKSTVDGNSTIPGASSGSVSSSGKNAASTFNTGAVATISSVLAAVAIGLALL